MCVGEGAAILSEILCVSAGVRRSKMLINLEDVQVGISSTLRPTVNIFLSSSYLTVLPCKFPSLSSGLSRRKYSSPLSNCPIINMVQPLHEIHAMRIRLDSTELLAYALTHRGETRIQEGIPLRPDEEQVGLEDLEVLEDLDPEYYTRTTS